MIGYNHLYIFIYTVTGPSWESKDRGVGQRDLLPVSDPKKLYAVVGSCLKWPA